MPFQYLTHGLPAGEHDPPFFSSPLRRSSRSLPPYPPPLTQIFTKLTKPDPLITISSNLRSISISPDKIRRSDLFEIPTSAGCLLRRPIQTSRRSLKSSPLFYFSLFQVIELLIGSLFHCSISFCLVRHRVRVTRADSSPERYLQALDRADEELRRGSERGALSIVKELQGKSGDLCCFGATRHVPQRIYSLVPVDITLDKIEGSLQITGILGELAAWAMFGSSQAQILYISVGLLFLWSVDLELIKDGCLCAA